MQKCVVLFSLVNYLCGSGSWKSPSLKGKSWSILGLLSLLSSEGWRVGPIKRPQYRWRRSWGERWSSRFKGPSTFLPSSVLTNFGSWLKVHSSEEGGGGCSLRNRVRGSVTWEEFRVILCSSTSRGASWGGLGSCIRCPLDTSLLHVPLGGNPGTDPRYTGGIGILTEEPVEVSGKVNLGVPAQGTRPTTQ